MIVVDLDREKVIKTILLRAGAMPQDVKLSPDGRTFYVADMASNGVWLIDAQRLRRDALRADRRWARTACTRAATPRRLFVSNRGEGSITRDLVPHPPAGGEVAAAAAAAARTWAACRPTAACCGCRAATTLRSTRSARAPGSCCIASRSASGPHGMAVWPQPGRYSIGHTGILR